MTLQEFLSLVQDEEARIELEIDFDDDAEKKYQCHHFWLSDFRVNDSIAKQYRHYKVDGFSFVPEQEDKADIMITIKA
jgi:hypothetical protein